MEDKQETNKNTANDLSCSLCAKFVKILKHKSENDTDDETEVKCDDCGSDDPVVALCINCEQCLCEVCNMYHSKKNSAHNVILLHANSQQKTFYCPEHPNNELDYYCETCDKIVCLYCTVKDHAAHKHDTLEVIATNHQNDLTKIISSVEEMSILLSNAEQDVFAMKENVVKQVKEVGEIIDKCYVDHLTKLNEQHRQLKKQLNDDVLQKEKALTTQLKCIRVAQGKAKNVKKLCQGLKNLTDCKALSQKKRDLEKSFQEVNDQYNLLQTIPVETDSIDFVPVENPTVQLGHLFTSAHPHTSEVVDLPHNIGYNSKVDITIQTRNCKGEKYTMGGCHILVELKSASGNVTFGEVKDNEDGSYAVSIVTEEVGEAMLTISMNGQQMKESPYKVVVGRNYHAITIPDEVINNNNNMGHPRGIAFGKNGVWAVVDNSNSCVYIYNSHDKLVQKFGSKGSNNGQFSNPCGVAFDSVNHSYIVEYGNSRVQKFSVNGNYLLQFGNDNLKGPVGITTHNGKVYVADCGNKHIAVFQANGQFCTSFGSECLSGPYDLAVSSNQLLVADHVYHCIFTFTLDGKFVHKFGTQGSDKGQLNNPRALAIDPNGFTLVADSENYRISIFDKAGNFVDCFGSQGSNAAEFLYPHGVALSPSGSIYISDHGNKRVQIFSNY